MGFHLTLRLTVDNYTKYLIHLDLSGDSDFSTDIHSFRFTKLWDIVLIHNAAAKEALKITATHALPFEAVMEKGKGAQGKKEWNRNKEGKEKERKTKSKAELTCKSGHLLTQRPAEDSGWFCSASKEPGGCHRALVEKDVTSGRISSSRRCLFLQLHSRSNIYFQVPFILLPSL